MGVTAFDKYADQKLFDVDIPKNSFHIPYNPSSDSSLLIKYVFAQTDSSGSIKRITLYIDDSSNNALSVLERTISPEHSTAQSSLGQPYGNIFYGWVTPEKTVIIMSKTDNINTNFGFPVTIINIIKQEDIQKFIGKNIHPRLPRY